MNEEHKPSELEQKILNRIEFDTADPSSMAFKIRRGDYNYSGDIYPLFRNSSEEHLAELKEKLKVLYFKKQNLLDENREAERENKKGYERYTLGGLASIDLEIKSIITDVYIFYIMQREEKIKTLEAKICDTTQQLAEIQKDLLEAKESRNNTWYEHECLKQDLWLYRLWNGVLGFTIGLIFSKLPIWIKDLLG